MQSARGKLRGKSVYSLGKSIQVTGPSGKVTKGNPTIVEGMKVQKVTALDEGIHVLSPEQLLSILVPTQEVIDGKIHGFQRRIDRPHIRRISSTLLQGKRTDPPTVSAYKQGLWAVDGQQRILAAVMARMPLRINVEHLSADEMFERFAQQIYAKKVDPSTIILSRLDDEYALYIQDALVNRKNPWHGIVAKSTGGTKKLTAKQVYDSIKSYSNSSVSRSLTRQSVKDFDEGLADELAVLVKTFGNKESNPLAFKPKSFKAITYAAVLIIRRNGSQQKDIERWVNWMPNFNFAEYMAVTRSNELASWLVKHWNKRLAKSNRIKLLDELD